MPIPYQLNQIIQGDALQLLTTLSDNSVNCILTDPPYNIQTDGGRAGKSKRWAGFDKIQEYSGKSVNFFTEEIFAEYERVCKPLFNCFVFCAKNDIPHILEFCKKRKYIWNLLPVIKINPIPLIRNRDWLSNEYAFHISAAAILASDKYHDKIPYFQMFCKKNIHPNQKPVELIQRILANITRPGNVVLDPFIGSGTTAVACKKSGRNYIGFEINPEYHKLAEFRIAEMDLCDKSFDFTDEIPNPEILPRELG